jgi:hypothetical protein
MMLLVTYNKTYLQAAQKKASLMASTCAIVPCKACPENYAYSPGTVAFDAKQATVMWAAQKQSYVYGECSG